MQLVDTIAILMKLSNRVYTDQKSIKQQAVFKLAANYSIIENANRDAPTAILNIDLIM